MKISKYDVAVVLSIMFLFASVALPLIHGNSLKFASREQSDPNSSPRRDMSVNYSIICNPDSSATLKVITTDTINANYISGSNVSVILYDPYLGQVANNVTNIVGKTSMLITTGQGTYQINAVQDAYRPSDPVYFTFSPCPVALPPKIEPPKKNETIVVNDTTQNNVTNDTINLPPVVEENKTEIITPENTTIIDSGITQNLTTSKEDKSSEAPKSSGIDAGLILLLLVGLGVVVLVAAVAYYFYASKGSQGSYSNDGAYKSRGYQPLSEAPKPKRVYKSRKKTDSGSLPPPLGA